jgi:signal transduction histidine kinase
LIVLLQLGIGLTRVLSALALLLVVFLPGLADAQSKPWVLSDEDVHSLVGEGVSMFRDPSRALTLEQVRSPAVQVRFVPLSAHLGQGYVADAYWLRFVIHNPHPTPRERWLEVMPTFLDDIRVHFIDSEGRVSERQGGDRLPQSAKEENYRGHVFKFALQPGPNEFFVRLETTSTVVAIIKLWQTDAFARHLRTSYFGFGLYFSLIFSVVLFNVVSWLLSRRLEIILYTAFLLANALLWAGSQGFTSEFLFPETPWVANLAQQLAIPLAGALAILFYIVALELRRHHSVAFRLSVLSIGVCGVGIVATLFGHFQSVAGVLMVGALISMMSIPWPAYRQWQTGDRAARLTALAYVLFGVLASINILGTLSATPYGDWTNQTGLAANVCHILLLHFALLQRLRQIELDRSAAVERSAVAERQAELERAHREDRDKLLAMIAHEIRTPVAVIDAATQTLARTDPNAEPSRVERYERVRRSVVRLTALLDVAVTQAAINVGRWQPEPVPINPETFTRDVVLLLGNPAAARVHVDVHGSLPQLLGDMRTLRFAILNLIDNACKYSSPESPVRVRLTPYWSERTEGILWQIEDEGRGIPAGMEEQIFDKHMRVDEQSSDRQQSGLGLGLYLCRHIVERHGGWVRAESGRSHGACFTCWLPCQMLSSPAE